MRWPTYKDPYRQTDYMLYKSGKRSDTNSERCVRFVKISKLERDMVAVISDVELRGKAKEKPSTGSESAMAKKDQGSEAAMALAA